MILYISRLLPRRETIELEHYMRYGWTFKKQDWNNLLEAISGTYWSSTKLDTLYQDDVPEGPGVYLICLKLRTINFKIYPFKDLYQIIYVGRSKSSVRNRFLRHCSRPERGVREAKECFGDNLEYWYTEINSDQVRELEAHLIRCFGPPANLRQESIPGRTTEGHPA